MRLSAIAGARPSAVGEVVTNTTVDPLDQTPHASIGVVLIVESKYHAGHRRLEPVRHVGEMDAGLRKTLGIAVDQSIDLV